MTEKSIESDPNMEFESTLYGAIGQFGRYQLLNVFLAAAAAMVGGYGAGDYLFTAARLPYRCAVPECDGTQPQYATDWILSAIPSTATGFDDCTRFAYSTNITETVNAEDCPASWFDRSTIIPCESYVYERVNSVVYDFNLECEEWLRALAGTLNSAGALVALPLAGYISDQFGRRVSIVFFAFNYSLTGLIRAFSINYTMYLAFQFVQIAIGGGIFSACYILATELVGPKYRVATGVSISTAFALGQMILGTYAYLVPDWRTLTLVLYTPLFLFLSYFWIISESHRWLISKHKKVQAKATIEKAARLNGKDMSEQNINYLLTIPQTRGVDNEEHKKNLFLRVIKSRIMLRRCCTTPVMWIATTFIYYGLSINSVSLSGNMYLNYIAVVAIEIPGFWTAFLLLGKVGRRAALFGGYMVCAACCIAFAFTPDNAIGVSMFFYLLGKYCIGLVMTTLYLYTVELYPTRYRHSFLGFSSMLGRIGSILAPLTPPLMEYWVGIPSLLFAGMAIVAGFLVLTQPETRGLTVPDTLEDAEQLGKR